MNQIVRRIQNTPVIQQASGDIQPARTYRAAGFFVTSELVLGFEPKVQLSWAVQQSYWAKGYTLLVFHSTSGFCPEKYPDDLNLHGHLIIETTRDATHMEHPDEGAHFYTFVLQKKGFLGLSEKVSVLRFSETIPSAKVAISRIRDKMQLEDMLRQHELGAVEHETKRNEVRVRRIRSRRELEDLKAAPTKVPKGIVADELAAIDAIVETLIAKRAKLDSLKSDVRFQSLKRSEQKEVVDRINERLDAGEISARREMRKS